MTSPPNITLERICDELGLVIFNRWQIEADREFRSSPYLYKGADARHAFEYEFIRRKYDALKASQLTLEKPKDVQGQREIEYHTKEHN